MNFIRTSTEDLHTGDLIMTSGMLVRLGERHVYRSGGTTGDTVYAFKGTVENMDEVYPDDAETAVWPLSGLLTRLGTWDVQGNRWAFWDRVWKI